MTGITLIAEFIKTGRLLGLSAGSSLQETEARMIFDHVDDGDGKTWMRRDYGLIEFNLSGPPWEVKNASIEIHRLASTPSLLQEWNATMTDKFEKYSTWSSLKREISGNDLQVKATRQGEFMQHLFVGTNVSVIVVANNEERDEWPGDGDIWSVHLG